MLKERTITFYKLKNKCSINLERGIYKPQKASKKNVKNLSVQKFEIWMILLMTSYHHNFGQELQI